MNRLTRHKMYYVQDKAAREILTVHQRSLVDFYNEGIKNGSIAKEEVPCLCGSNNFDTVALYDRYGCDQPTVLCRICGLMQSRPRYTEESIFWFYNSDFFLDLYTPGGFKLPSRDEYEVQSAARGQLRQRALQGLDPDNVKTVAEVGCQSGLNLYGFHLEGKEVMGCDWGPQMVDYGRKLGMDLRVGSTEQLEGRKFDLIILSHVLEHMRDPVGEIRKIAAHLNEQGGLYIEVPNAKVFDPSALQSAHLYYFSQMTLAHYLAPLNLKPVSFSTVADIHFGSVFKKSGDPASSDLSNEYREMRRIIQRSDLRDRSRDFVESLGLLPITRTLIRIFR